MDLTVRQRRALDAICDTFLPGLDGLPSATELGVPQAIADALDANPRESERRQTAQLLGLWDTALLTAVGGGGLRRFSSLPRERREAVLRSWCDSRVGQRRTAFTALRKAALLFGYMVPQTVLNRPTWFYKKEEAGGGIVEDMMAHFFDLLRHLVGPIEVVSATGGIAWPQRREAQPPAT